MWCRFVLIPNFLGAELSFSTVPNCLFQRVPKCLVAELSCFQRARRKNLRHRRERLLVSNEALPSCRPIEIFPAGVWDFSVLPSYRCLILFLTNFPILYVFRCLILFLTKHLCFVYIPSSAFPQNCFPLVKYCRFIDIHPCIGSILIVFHNKIQCI